jgi:hypothetical protein
LILQWEGEQEQQQVINILFEVVEEEVIDPDIHPIEDEEENNMDAMVMEIEEQQQNLINYALTLDVIGTRDNRPKRNAPGVTSLHNRRQLNPDERALVCFHVVYLMGWKKEMTKARKLLLQEAALTVVCYDRGYKKVIGATQVDCWIKNIEESIGTSEVSNVLASKNKGKTSYTDVITAMHPTYLHDMWHQSTRILGDAATFQEIATQINLQSAVLHDRPTLQLDKYKLWRWFKKNKGRKVSRPLLTEVHKERRLTYAQEMLERIEEEEEITFYKDEK